MDPESKRLDSEQPTRPDEEQEVGRGAPEAPDDAVAGSADAERMETLRRVSTDYAGSFDAEEDSLSRLREGWPE